MNDGKRVPMVPAFLVLPLGLSAQSPPGGAFVTRLGNDTVAVEQYTFDGDGLVRPERDGGVLAFSWERTEAAIRFTVH